MSAKTSMRTLPDMDDIKIGPAGQTFGQLKQRVRDTRLVYVTHPGLAALHDLEVATRMLKAAYVRVGLPYKAP